MLLSISFASLLAGSRLSNPGGAGRVNSDDGLKEADLDRMVQGAFEGLDSTLFIRVQSYPACRQNQDSEPVPVYCQYDGR